MVLSDSTAEVMLEKGLIPILSLPDRDIIRVVRFSDLSRALAGPRTRRHQLGIDDQVVTISEEAIEFMKRCRSLQEAL